LPYGIRLDLQLGLSWRTLFDWRVLAFTAGAGLIAGGVLGLVPAVQGTRADLGSALKAGSKGSDAPGPLRWRNVMVVAQIAMSLVLLVGAGLFCGAGSKRWPWTRALAGRRRRSCRSSCRSRGQRRRAPQRTRRLLERFRSLPGAAPLASSGRCRSNSRPATPTSRSTVVPAAGRETFRASRATVDGGFFDAAGMTIVAGRTFNDATGATVSPWPSSARRWRVATGRTATRWGGSSADPIRQRPTW
jgi:hypothetical protein